MVISAVSVYWSRQQYIKSSRPYVWACNFQTLAPGTNYATPVPYIIAVRVLNSPAKIIQLDFRIVLNEKELFSQQVKSVVRYPDDEVDWTLVLLEEAFDKLFLNIPNSLRNSVHRTIFIKYSSINGGRTYYYNLEQYFRPEANQWEVIIEEGN